MCQRGTALPFSWWRSRKPKAASESGSGVKLRVNAKDADTGLTDDQKREILLWLEPESIIWMEPTDAFTEDDW